MSKLQRIGFIGAGLMGHGIIKNLLGHGYPVMFLEHPGNQPSADLIELGAVTRSTVAGIAHDAEVVFICVTDSAQVESIVFDAQGLAGALQTGACVIDCSTVDPQTSLRVAAALNEIGVSFLDAPLTRTPLEAEAGRLNVMVGGDPVDLERVRPVLECFTENIYHAGAVGAGHTLKLLHNYVSLGNTAVLAEAAVCARRCGVGTDVFLEVLAAGGGDSAALRRLTPYLTAGDVGAFRFSLANSLKDMRYYAAVAQRLGVGASVAAAMTDLLEAAVKTDSGDEPLPRLVDILDRGGIRGKS